MARRKTRRSTRPGRSQRGSLLIFTVCALVLIFSLASPFLVFFANVSAQLVVKNDSEHIATQTANVLDDNRFWLDRLRPGYDQAKAEEVAKAAATAMCQKAGMTLKESTITTTQDTDGNHRTICTLKIDAKSRFPFLITVGAFDMNSYFKGEITATGFTEHSAQPPYSLIHMDAPTTGIDESHKRPLGFNQRDVAVVPSYGFFYTAVAGETKNPTPYGKGIAGLAPENFMSMNHYHFKKSDLEYVEETGKDVFNNGWHVERVIDGKAVKVANQ